jgi:GntR family transcriptional regulator, transcriptional repressor for pyruvate dehydrogenase complex
MFKSATTNKISDQIIEQIRQAIFEENLKPGDKLSPEKELMEVFKVSKSTLREALRSLETLGFLAIRKGASGGAFVTEVDMKKAGEFLSNFLYFKGLSLRDFSDVRILVESHIAEKAARMIAEEDLAKLGALNEAFGKQLKENIPTEFYDRQIEFHRILGHSTENPILILVLDFISNILLKAKEILRPGKDFYEDVLRAHKQIHKALLQRDPAKAREAMIRHIREEEQGLLALQNSTTIRNQGAESSAGKDLLRLLGRAL